MEVGYSLVGIRVGIRPCTAEYHVVVTATPYDVCYYVVMC
jgi:hypothetical protein